jgi:hypothetical protein
VECEDPLFASAVSAFCNPLHYFTPEIEYWILKAVNHEIEEGSSKCQVFFLNPAHMNIKYFCKVPGSLKEN